jgi:hypothetical protein
MIDASSTASAALADPIDKVLGFQTGYAHSAAVACKFIHGPMFRIIDYQSLDVDANFLGMRNFFVAVRIYGEVYACAAAMEIYGPSGVIYPGFLEWPLRPSETRLLRQTLCPQAAETGGFCRAIPKSAQSAGLRGGGRSPLRTRLRRFPANREIYREISKKLALQAGCRREFQRQTRVLAANSLLTGTGNCQWLIREAVRGFTCGGYRSFDRAGAREEGATSPIKSSVRVREARKEQLLAWWALRIHFPSRTVTTRRSR